jgi:hypothetical protein
MSQTEQNNVEGTVEYQLGSNDIDLSGSIADDDDVLEFNYESAAIFKRLADDIYETAEAGLREPLTNSITTSRRVKRNGDCDNPVITITVKDGEQPMLRLRDMGEGISRSVLENVLIFIGRSTARDDGELSGQYGMGFLASYKLVGMNGGFIMHTNARDSSEGPYHGLFKPGAFEPDNEGKIQPLLAEDEYGTVFEYFLKPDINISKVREWVESHAKFSPIPVIYKEMDKDGNEQYNEDFYAPTLKDAYGESPCLRVDTPYYEATTSPSANNDIVLISSPVDMRGTRALRNNLPWSVDLRIKYENGIVVDGPHEGLIPTTQKQYELMDDERKDDYVSKEKLTDDDLTLPEATGTRERVRRHKEFLRHVNSQLLEQYHEIVEETLDTFNPSTEAMQKMDEMQRNVIMRIFSHFDDDDDDYTPQDVIDKLDSEYDYDSPTTELVEFILTMTQQVSIISQRKTHKSRYTRELAYKLAESDAEIYMCTSANNSWKADAVEVSQKETDIITVNKAAEYDGFSKHLGWTPLKNIKKSNADEFLGLSEAEIEDVASTSKTTADNVNEKQLTIHYMSGGRNTFKRTSEALVSSYDNDTITNGSSRYGDVLVLFPQGGEHKVSDHYHLADNRCCVASCSKKVSDYLTENADGIMNYEDYREWVGSKKLTTSHGTRSVENIISAPRPAMLTPKSNTEDKILNDSIILSSFARHLKEKYKYNLTPTYALIHKNLCTHINSVYDEDEYDHITLFSTTANVSGHNFSSRYGDEVEIYAKVRLTEEQYNTSEVKTIISSYGSLDTTVVSIIETLVQSAEMTNGSFASQNEDGKNSIRMPTVNTKYGEIQLDEVYEYTRKSNVIIHTLSPEDIHIFEQKDILEFAGENLQGKSVDNTEFPRMNANPVYVPVLESEYKRVKAEIPDETIVINSEYRNNSVNIRNRFVYAAIKIHNWSPERMPTHIIQNNQFKEVKNLVDTLTTLHNNSDGENNVDSVESAVVVAQDALLDN